MAVKGPPRFSPELIVYSGFRDAPSFARVMPSEYFRCVRIVTNNEPGKFPELNYGNCGYECGEKWNVRFNIQKRKKR